MWCTRWFLALLLLPVPTASPYFLVIFILSIILQTRPCTYCMFFLAAFFASTCYWHPVPSTSSLTHPSGNITTFMDVMLSVPSSKSTALVTSSSLDEFESLLELNTTTSTNNYTNADSVIESIPVKVTLPTTVFLLDHCWCDLFSKSGFFAPFDVDAWERESAIAARRKAEVEALEKEKARIMAILREKEQEERRMKENEGMNSTNSEEVASGAETRAGNTINANNLNGNSDEAGSESRTENTVTDKHDISPFSFRHLRNIVFPNTSSSAAAKKYHLKPASSSPASSSTPVLDSHLFRAEENRKEEENDGSHINIDTATSPSPELPQQNHSASNITKQSYSNTDIRSEKLDSKRWLRRYYDLRPYGLDITVDFGWSG